MIIKKNIGKALSICMLGALLNSSCTSAVENNGNAASGYFDMVTFMKQEIKTLKQSNPDVRKTVSKNKDEETRVLKISDWEAELNSFIQSDINKSANKGLYKVDQVNLETHYTALQPNLSTQKMSITKDADGHIRSIYIQKFTDNLLYNNQEELFFYPDSAYEIHKIQTIPLLGTNNYDIKGIISHP